MWVEVGKDSQMCPWLHVIAKHDNKPMSYVAALHLVRNENYVHNYYGPYAYCSMDKGTAYTKGGGGCNGIGCTAVPQVGAVSWARLW